MLVTVMKMSLLAQSRHTDRLLKSPSHSRGVRRGTCAEVEVMSKSGLNVLVPAFRLHCSVHIIFLDYIIKKIEEVTMCLQKEPRSEPGYGNEAGS